MMMTKEKQEQKKIQQLLQYCEETFEEGNLETALRCAVSISIANPNAPQPYAHVTAYRILLTAATNLTITGEPDWYAVFGIKKRKSFKLVSESIKRRSSEIVDVFAGETGISKAVYRVYDLLRQGVSVMYYENKKNAYDLRCGFSS